MYLSIPRSVLGSFLEQNGTCSNPPPSHKPFTRINLDNDLVQKWSKYTLIINFNSCYLPLPVAPQIFRAIFETASQFDIIIATFYCYLLLFISLITFANNSLIIFRSKSQFENFSRLSSQHATRLCLLFKFNIQIYSKISYHICINFVLLFYNV